LFLKKLMKSVIQRRLLHKNHTSNSSLIGPMFVSAGGSVATVIVLLAIEQAAATLLSPSFVASRASALVVAAAAVVVVAEVAAVVVVAEVAAVVVAEVAAAVVVVAEVAASAASAGTEAAPETLAINADTGEPNSAAPAATLLFADEDEEAEEAEAPGGAAPATSSVLFLDSANILTKNAATVAISMSAVMKQRASGRVV
jgi:hypothetical protein